VHTTPVFLLLTDSEASSQSKAKFSRTVALPAKELPALSTSVKVAAVRQVPEENQPKRPHNIWRRVNKICQRQQLTANLKIIVTNEPNVHYNVFKFPGKNTFLFSFSFMFYITICITKPTAAFSVLLRTFLQLFRPTLQYLNKRENATGGLRNCTTKREQRASNIRILS
jgi:hypothetical protein